MRKFSAALIVLALLAPAAHAQSLSGATGNRQDDQQKSEKEEQAKRRKLTDQQYKATLERIPDKQKPTDPWGNMRAPAAAPGGK